MGFEPFIQHYQFDITSDDYDYALVKLIEKVDIVPAQIDSYGYSESLKSSDKVWEIGKICLFIIFIFVCKFLRLLIFPLPFLLMFLFLPVDQDLEKLPYTLMYLNSSSIMRSAMF